MFIQTLSQWTAAAEEPRPGGHGMDSVSARFKGHGAAGQHMRHDLAKAQLAVCGLPASTALTASARGSRNTVPWDSICVMLLPTVSRRPAARLSPGDAGDFEGVTASPAAGSSTRACPQTAPFKPRRPRPSRQGSARADRGQFKSAFLAALSCIFGDCLRRAAQAAAEAAPRQVRHFNSRVATWTKSRRRRAGTGSALWVLAYWQGLT